MLAKAEREVMAMRDAERKMGVALLLGDLGSSRGVLFLKAHPISSKYSIIRPGDATVSRNSCRIASPQSSLGQSTAE